MHEEYAVFENHVHGEHVSVAWEKLGDTSISWVAWRITGFDGDTRFYESNSDAYNRSVRSLAGAKRFCSGYLKWDGCNEWNFDDDQPHFCEPSGMAEAISEVARIVQRVGYREMPGAMFYDSTADESTVLLWGQSKSP